jgi:ubiquinone/menaquinone biosynthesis C-methylase UbiE
VNRSQRQARRITNVVVRFPFLWPLLRGRMTKLFDDVAPQWDAMTSPERLVAFEAALEHVPGEPRAILDLGTGTGDGAVALAERWPDAEVVGVDVSREMLEEARKKAPQLRFEVGDASGLKFPDRTFDLVAMNNVIPFVGELARVVRPGGHVLFAFSRGDETPIYVPPGLLRRKLDRGGFEVTSELAAGPGTALVARRDETG